MTASRPRSFRTLAKALQELERRQQPTGDQRIDVTAWPV
jgi:hypothetical protein